MAIVNTAVVAEHGAVYRAGGQGVQDITTKFFQPLESEAYFKVIPTEKTVIDKSHWTVTRVLQRYQDTFTKISTTTLTPDKCVLGHLKIDIEENPSKLEDDWHGFLVSNNLKRSQWPFIQFWLQSLIMKQELEDFELNEFYKGELGTVVDGTATDAGRSINGIRYQLNNRSGVNTISMGAMPTDPELVSDYIEDWWAQIPRLHRKLMDRVFVNEAVLELYLDGQKEKDVVEARRKFIKDTSVIVTGLPSMEGDEKVWTMPTMFRYTYAKKPENVNFFNVEESKRSVAVMTDYYRQPWFWFAQYAYMNDLELTTLYP